MQTTGDHTSIAARGKTKLRGSRNSGNFGNRARLLRGVLFRVRTDFINGHDDLRFQIGHPTIIALHHRHIFNDYRLLATPIKLVALNLPRGLRPTVATSDEQLRSFIRLSHARILLALQRTFHQFL